MVWQVRFPQNKQHNLKIKTNGIKTKQNLTKSDRHPEKKQVILPIGIMQCFITHLLDKLAQLNSVAAQNIVPQHIIHCQLLIANY